MPTILNAQTMKNKKLKKNQSNGEIFKSFTEWEESYFTKKLEKEKLDRLMKDSSLYGAYLADTIIDDVISSKK